MAIRAYVLTTEDPLYTKDILASLDAAHPGAIVGVGLCAGTITPRRVLIGPFLYGFVRFAALAAATVWGWMRGGPVARFCQASGIALDQWERGTEEAIAARLRALDADVLISVNCPWKLAGSILRAPAKGAINLHFGKLPAYRGLMPLVHALANGEVEVGATVHYMNEDFDDGPIIAQATLPVLLADDLFSLWERATRVGARLLENALAAIDTDTVRTRPNPAANATYHSWAGPLTVYRYRCRVVREKITEALDWAFSFSPGRW